MPIVFRTGELLSLLHSHLSSDFSARLDLVVQPDKKYACGNQLYSQALSRLRSSQKEPASSDDHNQNEANRSEPKSALDKSG